VLAAIYFGGIAGDEPQVYQLLEQGKLDGSSSGGALCRKVAPSMHVLDIGRAFELSQS
jgi:TRAP-type C4-dicarboxylate transport system substrate-binding protein